MESLSSFDIIMLTATGLFPVNFNHREYIEYRYLYVWFIKDDKSNIKFSWLLFFFSYCIVCHSFWIKTWPIYTWSIVGLGDPSSNNCNPMPIIRYRGKVVHGSNKNCVFKVVFYICQKLWHLQTHKMLSKSKYFNEGTYLGN